MKVLIIIASHEFNIQNLEYIESLNNYMKLLNCEILDYAGISNNNDFENYESVIHFKYKIINTKLQLCKITDFIIENKDNLNYDWYIKTRPDVKLLDQINFDILSKSAINARARLYKGPKRIKYGISVGGVGGWNNIIACSYSETEEELILDDMLYIFNHDVIEKIKNIGQENYTVNNEWGHTEYWVNCGIDLNIVGIYLYISKHYSYSGDLNILSS